MKIAVAGAGAFGTSLAIAMAAEGQNIGLWARNADHAATMSKSRENAQRLSGIKFPNTVSIHANFKDLDECETVLLAVPAQSLAAFLKAHQSVLDGKNLVACCKGIDLATNKGPTAIIESECPNSKAAMLTGPSFATDIAKGLPTAITIACADEKTGELLQSQLSTRALRLYLTTDVIGAELGGALKNVMAIACGATMGMGMGESARAALMTRGFAEMMRLSLALGAHPTTLNGLSGFGDLTLTCTSDQSRNYKFGYAIGRNETFDPTITVEGAKTAKAVSNIAKIKNIDMPITTRVADVVDGKLTLSEALETLLDRPLKKE